jgi:hypothetical protein
VDETDPDPGQSPVRQLARVGEPELLAEAGAVPRAVDLARENDNDRCAAGDPLLGDLVRAVFGLVIPAQEPLVQVPLICLVGGDAVRVAVDVAGRHVDGSRRAGPPDGIEDPRRRPDVRVPHRRSLGRRDPDPIASRGVDQRVGAAQRLGDRSDVGQVARDQLGAEVSQERGPLRVADEGDHPIAPLAEEPDDGPADEAGAAGDDDPHRLVDRCVGSDALEPGLDVAQERCATGAVVGPVVDA